MIIHENLLNFKIMNIYLLEQDLVNGWDTYDSCVVVAKNEKEARETHPNFRFVTHVKDEKWMGTYIKGGEYENEASDWVACCDINKIKVTLIGVPFEDVKAGVVVASFNAG